VLDRENHRSAHPRDAVGAALVAGTEIDADAVRSKDVLRESACVPEPPADGLATWLPQGGGALGDVAVEGWTWSVGPGRLATVGRPRQALQLMAWSQR
jgi:hypothetical protein